jgi:hypothetical protein
MEIQDMFKIKLAKNSKMAVEKWSQEEYHYKTIKSSYYNVGLLTGKINNIIVLDVDAKDDGIQEMDLYYKEYGQINTLKQLSPNGGYHLFFKYTSSDEDDQYLIDHCLLNTSKFRNKGLDIRSNKGYIIVEPSQIDGKKYKFVNPKAKLIEMPRSLIEFLLFDNKEGPRRSSLVETTSPRKNFLHKIPYIVDPKNYVYDHIEDHTIIKLLKLLEEKFKCVYCNETRKWLIITHILKSLDKYQLWDDWSTMSEKYDAENNKKIWNSITPIYDINYLTFKLNFKPINRYKRYDHLTSINDVSNIERRTINEEKIKLELNDLKMHDTIVMKSTTGTGKTTTTSKIIYDYNETNIEKKKVLSIISKKSLCDQHINSFRKAGINLTSYLEKDKKLKDDNIVVCINSILILSHIPNVEFSNYIVYIDEIASFLKDITHNDTLRGKLKLCYQILMRIIKNCCKLIVSDAKITDNVFNFLNVRSQTQYKKILFVKNEFKKYIDVPAIKVRDEQLFLDKMTENVKNKQYFLCASDSCSQVTKLYLECRKTFTDQRLENKDLGKIDDKFLLITADSPFKITDASVQFENKFVFYSPTIIFGVDFSIYQPQDVFIYNKGHTLDPSAIYQQTTRTRNIKTLYYYSELTNKQPKYNSLDECKTFYENICQTSSELNEVCVVLDENENEKIIKNTFFNLFTYNEYVNDIYKTNLTSHYEVILKDNGFVLSEIGQLKKMDKVKSVEMREALNEIKENDFQQLIDSKDTDNITINDHMDLLKLRDASNDTLETYKNIILDKHKLQEHLNIIRLLKTEDYVHNKISKLEEENFTVTNINSSYHKLKQILLLSKNMNLKHRLEVENTNFNFVDINDKQYMLICKIFCINRKKPTDNYNLMKLYVSMLRNLCSNEIIISEYGTTRQSMRKVTYKINSDLIKHNTELDKYKNKYLDNYDKNILDLLNIEIPIKPINPIIRHLLDVDINDDVFEEY